MKRNQESLLDACAHSCVVYEYDYSGTFPGPFWMGRELFADLDHDPHMIGVGGGLV